MQLHVARIRLEMQLARLRLLIRLGRMREVRSKLAD